jgi:hypothetical protein
VVTGPLGAGWQITDVTAGATLTYTKALGATDVLTINTDDFPANGFPGRGVYLNTQNNQRAALLVPNGWPKVLPGASATYTLRSVSFTTATLIVNLRSVWH